MRIANRANALQQLLRRNRVDGRVLNKCETIVVLMFFISRKHLAKGWSVSYNKRHQR